MAKTQQDLFTSLTLCLSEERLRRYQQSSESEKIALARYLWNVQLCEALYPALHAVEVAVRNSLHAAIATAYGQDDWYDFAPTVLHQTQQDQLAKAKRELSRERKALTPGRVVAALPFGFWTNLLNRYYETKGSQDPRLWPRLLGPAFPSIPLTLRTRAALFARLGLVRELRNRAFHHEPICPVLYQPDLLQGHQAICDLIGWINEDLANAIGLVDRFRAIYSAGLTRCESQLSGIVA